MSIKKVQKINTKLCTNCYSPIYLKVNLSYFNNKNIEKIDKNLKKNIKRNYLIDYWIYQKKAIYNYSQGEKILE